MVRTKKTARVWNPSQKKKTINTFAVMQQKFNCLDKAMVRRSDGHQTPCVIIRVYYCNHHGKRMQPNYRVGPKATRSKANLTHCGIIRYGVAWEDANGEAYAKKNVPQHYLTKL